LKFRKINETTINCIITQDDLKEHGINLDDLFDRKKNAVEFIRGVILKAANSVNLSMKNDYTSMRISVLPDRSVSLTISQDPAVSARTREMTGKAGAVKKETADKNNAADGKKDRKGLRSNTASASGTFVFEFPSIMDMAACSHILAAEPGLRSSVYFIESTGSYYLVLEKTNGVSPDYDSRVLSVNEFGTMVNCSDKTLAFMREHSDCILYRNAVQRISELYH
jgi:adapter protein MecA 1/2